MLRHPHRHSLAPVCGAHGVLVHLEEAVDAVRLERGDRLLEPRHPLRVEPPGAGHCTGPEAAEPPARHHPLPRHPPAAAGEVGHHRPAVPGDVFGRRKPRRRLEHVVASDHNHLVVAEREDAPAAALHDADALRVVCWWRRTVTASEPI